MGLEPCLELVRPFEETCFRIRHAADDPQLDIAYLVRLSLPLVATYQSEALTALGDPTRRAIFERLADRPGAVGEVAREMPVSRPAVSQHLKVLKEAGLVIDRRAGNRRIYQVDPDGVSALRAYLDHFWTRSLTAFKAAVEQEEEAT
jgi:DNA-binding transcriptional ArsR family regulator